MSCDNSQSHGCPSKCCATPTSNDSDVGSVRYVAGGNGMRGREVGQRSEGLGAGRVGPSVRGVLAECMQGKKSDDCECECERSVCNCKGVWM